jgi:hypothetical protein
MKKITVSKNFPLARFERHPNDGDCYWLEDFFSGEVFIGVVKFYKEENKGQWEMAPAVSLSREQTCAIQDHATLMSLNPETIKITDILPDNVTTNIMACMSLTDKVDIYSALQLAEWTAIVNINGYSYSLMDFFKYLTINYDQAVTTDARNRAEMFLNTRNLRGLIDNLEEALQSKIHQAFPLSPSECDE